MSEAGSLIRSLSGRMSARNFHSFVINEIGVGIVSGRFPAGSILPNDAAMMDEYGVSRTVLREALKTLEAKGLVEARPKVGTRVSPRNRWNLFDSQVLSWFFAAKPDLGFMESLADIQLALELRAVSLAAHLRTADHIRLMRYWVNQMDKAITSPEVFGLAELELHRTIAEAAENPFLKSIVGLVELAISSASLGAKPIDDDFRTASVTGYQKLASAIEQGDSDSAEAHIRALIAGSLASTRRRLLEEDGA